MKTLVVCWYQLLSNGAVAAWWIYSGCGIDPGPGLEDVKEC